MAAKSLALQVGVVPACRALGVSRATFYRRHRMVPGRQQPRPTPARALCDTERERVLDTLACARFVDRSPAEVVATLLDEGRYLCSERTMYRILAANQPVRERRNQLTHPNCTKPELVATGPNQTWSWDITRLLGPKPWTYFYLYVLLDIFSRYTVGWMVDALPEAIRGPRDLPRPHRPIYRRRQEIDRSHVDLESLVVDGPVDVVGERRESAGKAVGNAPALSTVLSARPEGLAPVRRTRPKIHRTTPLCRTANRIHDRGTRAQRKHPQRPLDKHESVRGAPMTSKCTAQLLADLGVTRSLSRPQVSDDNPFSEAQFKTLKYHPSFPGRFEDVAVATGFCRSFFPWYNTEHRHAGIAMLTPQDVHYGRAQQVLEQRERTLRLAWDRHPERFVSGTPKPQPLPNEVWINPPAAAATPRPAQ